MEIKDLLPIGSVVLLQEMKKTIMIFGIKQTNLKTKEEYDYIGVLFPEGNLGGKSQIMFNHDKIVEVIFRGYEDDSRAKFLEKLDQYYKSKGKN